MKRKTLKHALLAVSLLAIAGPASRVASAHTLSPAVVGKAANAADVYEITCYDAGDGTGTPVRLIGEVKGIGPNTSARAMLTIEKDSVAVSSVDWKTGDRKLSPEISNAGGPGTYKVTVSKTAKPGQPDKARAKKLIYGLIYHCLSATGHAGTNLVTIQNQ